MKLQEFIAETLKAYIAGVKDAQEYAAEYDARVNPPTLPGDTRVQRRQSDAPQDVQDVEFDVAVTSSEGSTTKGGAGIFVAAIGMGVQAKADTTNSSISRIKFKVPVGLPVQWPKR
jgi:hypothetical protein